MSTEERKKVREVFTEFDKDKDGTLTIDEVVAAASALAINTSKEGLLSWLKTYYNKDEYQPFNSLNFAAFVLRNKFQKRSEDEIRSAFDMFDQNGDGFVDFNELKAIFVSLGQELTDDEVESMLKSADSNGDGKISYEEFREIQ